MIAIMPMAGRGSRFSGSTYVHPKPLIPVNGVPMFIHATRSLKGIDCSLIVFIALKEHEEKYGLKAIISAQISLPFELILLDEVTEGQLCTTMAALPFLTAEDILIIASDTVILSDMATDIQSKPANCKGIISVANMPGSQWSFARTDENGKVVEVSEKNRISDLASTGMYYFSNGLEFYNSAQEIVDSKDKTRGEYFVIQVYKKYIEKNGLVTVSSAKEMWDMGTPESLSHYLEYVSSR